MTEEKSIFSEFPLSDELPDQNDPDKCERCPVDTYCTFIGPSSCAKVLRSAKQLDTHIKSLLKKEVESVVNEQVKTVCDELSLGDDIYSSRKEAVKAAEEYALSVATDGVFVKITHNEIGLISVESLNSCDASIVSSTIVRQFKYHEMQPGYVYAVWNDSDMKFYAVFSGEYDGDVPIFKNSLNGAIRSTWMHWKQTGIKAE